MSNEGDKMSLAALEYSLSRLNGRVGTLVSKRGCRRTLMKCHGSNSARGSCMAVGAGCMPLILWLTPGADESTKCTSSSSDPAAQRLILGSVSLAFRLWPTDCALHRLGRRPKESPQVAVSRETSTVTYLRMLGTGASQAQCRSRSDASPTIGAGRRMCFT